MVELDFLRLNSTLESEFSAKTFFSSCEVKNGVNKLVNVPIKGTDSEIASIENIEISEGRYFTTSENNTRSKVAFLGFDTAKELFPNKNSPLNEFIYINNEPYKVIGIQESDGDPLDQSKDNFIAIPLNTYSYQFGKAVLNNLIFVIKAKSNELMDEAVEEVRSLLRANENLNLMNLIILG